MYQTRITCLYGSTSVPLALYVFYYTLLFCILSVRDLPCTTQKAGYHSIRLQDPQLIFMVSYRYRIYGR